MTLDARGEEEVKRSLHTNIKHTTMDQKVGSVTDWMSEYDTNGDGRLDVSELQDLQSRLSKQMTDNIQLTKHLNALETRSANHSTEVKEKEATLRKALEAMDYARTVQNELRSKLALAEQNATIMSAEVNVTAIDVFSIPFPYLSFFLRVPQINYTSITQLTLVFLSSRFSLLIPPPNLIYFFKKFKKHVYKKQWQIDVQIS